MEVESKYVFGNPRIPPWVGDRLKDIEYDLEGNPTRAVILTGSGKKTLTAGDVLMKLGNSAIPIGKDDARKYGVTR